MISIARIAHEQTPRRPQFLGSGRRSDVEATDRRTDGPSPRGWGDQGRRAFKGGSLVGPDTNVTSVRLGPLSHFDHVRYRMCRAVAAFCSERYLISPVPNAVQVIRVSPS
jgi:hypothetical protein